MAGVCQLVEQGEIKPNDEVVTILTGNLLKDPNAVIDYHSGAMDHVVSHYANPIHQIAADFDALAAWVAEPSRPEDV